MANFRKRGLRQWQAQIRKRGHPPQIKTFDTRAAAEAWARSIEVEMDRGLFVSRAEAESTTLGEFLERYLTEITPRKTGAGPETNRIRALLRHLRSSEPSAASTRDERLRKVSRSTVKRDLTILPTSLR